MIGLLVYAAFSYLIMWGMKMYDEEMPLFMVLLSPIMLPIMMGAILAKIL